MISLLVHVLTFVVRFALDGCTTKSAHVKSEASIADGWEDVLYSGLIFGFVECTVLLTPLLGRCIPLGGRLADIRRFDCK